MSVLDRLELRHRHRHKKAEKYERFLNPCCVFRAPGFTGLLLRSVFSQVSQAFACRQAGSSQRPVCLWVRVSPHSRISNCKHVTLFSKSSNETVNHPRAESRYCGLLPNADRSGSACSQAAAEGAGPVSRCPGGIRARHSHSGSAQHHDPRGYVFAHVLASAATSAPSECAFVQPALA